MRCLISDHDEMMGILKECLDCAREIHDEVNTDFNMEDFMMGVLAGYVSAGYNEIKATLFVYGAFEKFEE